MDGCGRPGELLSATPLNMCRYVRQPESPDGSRFGLSARC